jgi:hypothetical protein
MDDSKALKDILETVVFIKDNAASKADLAAFELRVATKEDLVDFATKDDLRGMKNELTTHLDGLVVLPSASNRRSLRIERTTAVSRSKFSASRSI